MGKINFNIQEDIDEKFRKKVARTKGLRRGNMTKALEEAMLMWIKSD